MSNERKEKKPVDKELRLKNTLAYIEKCVRDEKFMGNIILPVRFGEVGTIKTESFIDPESPSQLLFG